MRADASLASGPMPPHWLDSRFSSFWTSPIDGEALGTGGRAQLEIVLVLIRFRIRLSGKTGWSNGEANGRVEDANRLDRHGSCKYEGQGTRCG